MASIAALPILIGLAVDYAIQFQARFDETGSATRGRGCRRPTIGTACLATAAGFLALQLSPIPMVRGFGWLLIVGVAVAFVPRADYRSRGAWRCGGGRVLPRAPRERLPIGRLLSVARTYPEMVLSVGVALALVGWVAGTQVETVSDIRSLAPQNIKAVEGLNELQDTTGVSGSST